MVIEFEFRQASFKVGDPVLCLYFQLNFSGICATTHTRLYCSIVFIARSFVSQLYSLGPRVDNGQQAWSCDTHSSLRRLGEVSVAEQASVTPQLTPKVIT